MGKKQGQRGIPFKAPAGSRYSPLRTPFAGFCSHCAEIIEVDHESLHISGGGLYHPECLDVSEAQPREV